MPRQTPYDDNAGARAVYLQAYWEGYRFGTEHPAMIVSSYHPQGPYAIPKEEGYSRGEGDAKRAASKRRLDEERRQAEESTRASTVRAQAVESLNTTANDVAADPDERCRAIFSLFQQFIKPCSTPSEIHEVLTDTRWLEQTNVIGIYVLAGWIPVEWEFGHDTPFGIFVLPSIKPSSGRPPNLGYYIYLTLAGGASRSEQSAFGILTGQQTWNTNVVLKEFALCYPDGTIECIKQTGTRKFNMYAK